MISPLRDWLLDPLALLFILCCCCYLFSVTRRRGRSTLWFLPLFVLLISGAPGIVNPLLANLEDRHPDEPACPAGLPVVVFGDGVNLPDTAAGQFDYLNTGTLARAAAASRLAGDEPEAAIVLAGGARQGVSEAAVMAEFLEALGVPGERLLLEERSFDTASNAINVVRLLDDEGLPRDIRLVTSALQMTRARAVFARLGVQSCAVSVDRQSVAGLPWYALLPQTATLVKFDRWLQEVVALAIYRIRGFI